MSDWPRQDGLAALAELSIDALAVVSMRDTIEWASQSFATVLGYDASALAGTRLGDLIAAEDVPQWQLFVSDILARPAAFHATTLRCRQRNGSIRWTQASGRNLVNEPRVRAIVICFHDVTPPSASDPALKATQDRYRQLFEDATDVVFETDAEGYFRLVNPYTLRVFGYTLGEVLGRRFTEFIRNDYRSVVLAHYRRQADSHEPTSYIEFPALTKAGDEIWVGQNAWLVTDPDGRFGGMRAVARDITERRQAEDALRQAQKMEAVGRLAGGIAHDFNNLLTAIRGNAELLAHHLQHDPSCADEVDEILQASDRAASLTRQLLAFSRKHEVRPVLLDLNQRVETVVRLARRLIGPERSLETQIAGSLKPVVADPAQVEQLLLNLILNARDAVSPGGFIVVTTTNCRLPDSANDASLPDGDYVRLQVIDDGEGMDQATQARIFEPFFTTKEPGRGTGLGLSTAYGMVRQMGGAITVVSERHKGSIFSVYLPVALSQTAYA